jgi:bacterial/archaeal transporter family protein
MQPWIIYALLSAASAGAVAVFGKLGLKGVDSTLATAVRSVVMTAFLVSAAAAFGKLRGMSSIEPRTLGWIAASGVAGAVSWLFYFLALKTGPATAVAALDRLSVVFVVIFAVVILGEALTWKTGLGAAAITIGAILMTLK